MTESTPARQPDDLTFAIRMHDLKAETTNVSGRRFEHIYIPLLARFYGSQSPANQEEAHMHKLRLACTAPVTAEHLTAMDLFVRDRRDLSTEEQATLLSWRQASFALTICSISHVHGDLVYVYNPAGDKFMPVLVPQLDQNVAHDFMRHGALLINRLVPVRDFFITVEPLSFVPAEQRLEVLQHIRGQMKALGGPLSAFGVAALDLLVNPPSSH